MVGARATRHGEPVQEGWLSNAHTRTVLAKQQTGVPMGIERRLVKARARKTNKLAKERHIRSECACKRIDWRAGLSAKFSAEIAAGLGVGPV